MFWVVGIQVTSLRVYTYAILLINFRLVMHVNDVILFANTVFMKDKF